MHFLKFIHILFTTVLNVSANRIPQMEEYEAKLTADMKSAYIRNLNTPMEYGFLWYYLPFLIIGLLLLLRYLPLSTCSQSWLENKSHFLFLSLSRLPFQ